MVQILIHSRVTFPWYCWNPVVKTQFLCIRLGSPKKIDWLFYSIFFNFVFCILFVFVLRRSIFFPFCTEHIFRHVFDVGREYYRKNTVKYIKLYYIIRKCYFLEPKKYVMYKMQKMHENSIGNCRCPEWLFSCLSAHYFKIIWSFYVNV